MLTKKENLLETINGGSPDRYVKRFEAMCWLAMGDPVASMYETFEKGTTWKNAWGVTITWPEWLTSSIPLHGPGLNVVDDILNWRDTFHNPDVHNLPESSWAIWDGIAATCDHGEQFLTVSTYPGLMDQLHMLMGMEEAFVAVLDEPEEVSALVNCYADFLIDYVSVICDRYHPDALFEHDDWGSKISTLTSPQTFDEIFLEPYKRMHAAYRELGIHLIIHHSDSYAATLAPEMIAMDVDVWQGVLTSNDVPRLVREYGPELTIMGGIDSDEVDVEGATRELIAQRVEEICRACGTKYFVPCTTMGGSDSLYPGVSDMVDEEIDRMSAIMFA